jgi:cystinosin
MILYDCLGYICLSVYSIAMYCVPSIREAYRNRHNGNDPTVLVNDVFFAVHGIALTAFPLMQMAWYDGKKQMPSMFCFCSVFGTTAVIFVYLFIVLAQDSDSGIFCMYNWIYMLAFVKLGVTILKYMPQVFLNWLRQSTEGWNIMQIILDLMGGLLSSLQLILDANDTGDWGGVIGNIQKLLLGIISVLFDLIFIFQHYCLYHGASPRTESMIGEGRFFGGSDTVKSKVVYESLISNEAEEEDGYRR